LIKDDTLQFAYLRAAGLIDIQVIDKARSILENPTGVSTVTGSFALHLQRNTASWCNLNDGLRYEDDHDCREPDDMLALPIITSTRQVFELTYAAVAAKISVRELVP
jgi:hypothetical protein